MKPIFQSIKIIPLQVNINLLKSTVNSPVKKKSPTKNLYNNVDPRSPLHHTRKDFPISQKNNFLIK